MREGLPIFMLKTVLFPSVQLPLHVFEARYMAMMSAVIAGDGLLGVNLIRKGAEVGELAQPYPVGTLARVVSQRDVEDGRMFVVVEGLRRYRILEEDRSASYLRANVTFLEDGRSAEDERLAREMLGRFERLLEQMRLDVTLDDSLGNQPDRLSYVVAAYIPRSNKDKQMLLTLDSVTRRLAFEGQWLDEILTGIARRQEIESIVRKNGKMPHGVPDDV